MFPWVCLAAMPLFYPFDWPHLIINDFVVYYRNVNHFICKKYKRFCKYVDLDTKIETTDLKNKISDDLPNEMVNVYDDFNQGAMEKSDMEITKSKAVVRGNEEKVEESCHQLNIETPNHRCSEERNKKITVYLILIYMFVQAFLPYSHFITKVSEFFDKYMYGVILRLINVQLCYFHYSNAK